LQEINVTEGNKMKRERKVYRMQILEF